MKIAIAIFGIPRGASVTFEPLVKNVVEPAREAGEVKLFGHLFNVGHIVNVRSGEGGILSQENYDLYKDFNATIEPPEHCLANYDLDAIKKFGDYYGDEFKSVRNLLHQLHSLKSVAKSINSYEPDVVIFVRPDLLYHDKVPAWVIRSAGAHPNRCFLPHWQWWGGYNDRFAVCGRNAYLHYGTRIDNILNYCSSTNHPLHAERLLRQTLRSRGARLRQLDVRASRVRIGDVVKVESFDARSTVGPRRLLPEMWLSEGLTSLHL